MSRSTPSTSSSAATTTFFHPHSRYRRADLRQAQSADKSAFEYWTHALSYVPRSDFRFFVPDMKLHRREGHAGSPMSSRRRPQGDAADWRGGALTIRDIDDDVLAEKEHLWASRKPSKRALQLAFYGRADGLRRIGMLKTYELMTRHFGWDKPPKSASSSEITSYLLDRALAIARPRQLDSICHLDAPNKAGRPADRCQGPPRRTGAGRDEDAGKQEHWARPRRWSAGARRRPPLVHILSPFDPLIIQRKRTHLIFDYEHRFEAYVPKPKSGVWLFRAARA